MGFGCSSGWTESGGPRTVCSSLAPQRSCSAISFYRWWAWASLIAWWSQSGWNTAMALGFHEGMLQKVKSESLGSLKAWPQRLPLQLIVLVKAIHRFWVGWWWGIGSTVPCAQLFSRVWLFATPWTVAHQAPLSMESSRQDAGVGSHFLLHHLSIELVVINCSCL